ERSGDVRIRGGHASCDRPAGKCGASVACHASRSDRRSEERIGITKTGVRPASSASVKLSGSMSAPNERLFTPGFFVMCGFTFTVFLSAFQLLPTAPFHILDLGGSTFASGLFLGFLTYSSAFSAPFTGAIADSVGQRRVLLTSSIALTVFSL